MASFVDVIKYLPAEYDVAEDPEYLEIRHALADDELEMRGVPEIIITESVAVEGELVAMFYPYGFDILNETASIVTDDNKAVQAFIKRHLV